MTIHFIFIAGKKTSKLIYCINCNKTWKYRPGAEKSCRTCKLSFEYKCGKCMKTYSSIISLNRHQAAYCNKLQQKISCDHCNYKTIRKSHLSSHIKSKHLPKNPRSNKCSKCGSCFSWRSDLRRHSKFCGQTNELKYKLLRYSCEHCNYKINQKSDLVKHLQAKHLPRDLSLNKCKKCGKCYSYQAGLRHHLKTCGLSEEEKLSLMSYPCNYCSYKSNKKSNLAAHTKAKH